MPGAVGEELSRVAKLGVSDEYSDYLLYQALAKQTKDQRFAAALLKLAETERKHYEFWLRYVPDEKPSVGRMAMRWVFFLKSLFGITFAVRYLELHEAEVVAQYESVARLIPDPDRAAFEEMLSDEREHEKEFAGSVEGSSVRYISFVVLGLADALVEITGIHAGSLGIYHSTEIAGLAGVIAGAAASLSMASAAFAQAKQGFKGSAKLSALYTGVSYFITAVVLATPYFLTKDMILALGTSLTLAVFTVTFTTYYSSVISSRPFRRDFAEIIAIIFAVTVALYVFGLAVRAVTGISV